MTVGVDETILMKTRCRSADERVRITNWAAEVHAKLARKAPK